MSDEELTTKQRARIASAAQAQAHRELREKHAEEYKAAYQKAKDELTRREQRR